MSIKEGSLINVIYITPLARVQRPFCKETEKNIAVIILKRVDQKTFSRQASSTTLTNSSVVVCCA